MTRVIYLVMIIFWGSMLLQGFMEKAFCGGNRAILEGDSFPDIVLSAPPAAKDAHYLGLGNKKEFSLRDIQADLILVEIMNVYCHSCQAKAPINNKLLELINSDPQTRGKIKMLSIAVGSTDNAIQAFKKEYKIIYPMIEDPEFEAYDAFGMGGVPRTYFIRSKTGEEINIVAKIQEGMDPDCERKFEETKKLMGVDSAKLRAERSTEEQGIKPVKPVVTEAELNEIIKTAFNKEGSPVTDIEKLDLEVGGHIYTQKIMISGKERRVFAVVVSRVVPCNVCHDIHFVYLFEDEGKILQMIPIQLSKYGNKKWSEADIEKMRGRIVGRYMSAPFKFNPEIDAVSRATITSSMIFKSLNEGIAVLNELKAKKYLRGNTF